MPIPDYQTLMLPLLRFAADGNDHTTREAVEILATEFQLTPAERNELLASGQQAIFNNRVGWANSYLKKAGLLESPRRGALRITARGKKILGDNPTRIDVKYLERFPEFIEFRDASRNNRETTTSESVAIATEQTPEEALELAHQSLRLSLAQDILSRILSCSPTFFERLVVELLVKMGYGGSRRDAGERIGQSGDGGIDGIIKEDRLGLDTIYIQAKRWQGSVGRPEIQKFVGALQGQRAKKGVFITTSSYTAEAIDYASRIDTKVVLIDGQLLANLMMDFDVGVSVSASYIVKRIDSDYFEEGEVGL
ncbi:MAG: restriction endonuclease [Candidatus Accumulibacter sp.]|uniref:Restriction endonuclease n=2 Tax=Candidatus Accumulibacter TaxID=327159 RepID=A0A7D5SFM2_9PROT|nr:MULTISPECIES: restriction endonuclease [Candidatus Accumulibacter]MBO3709056.1 restriction endonuclease [Accumulibacter sp.]MCC2867255.1 restriction endonuclease [Candidatus Accumulibacter phosphatis]QLH51079.1 MAG: restriction endonuclease [Candidatus Accumulibacter cognatus]TMQ77844.1 Mrr restriction system protein [Candidatus Accumulibacter phosphatis]